MHTHRSSIARSLVTTASVAVVATTGLVLSSTHEASSSPKPNTRPEVNRMEHEAHRFLGEARREQIRVLNPREHLAHQGRSGVASSSHVVPAADPSACSVRLALAWRTLGHFSDGYESFLLHQPPCVSPTGGGRSGRS